MKRKLWVILLTMVLLAVLWCGTAAASSSGTCGENLTWTLYDDDTLTIKAEHSESNDEQNDEGEYVRRERYYGSYSRSFNVSEIDVDGITAGYENGILTLNMPKKAPVKPESKHLEIL